MRGIILSIKIPIVIYATYWEHTKSGACNLFTLQILSVEYN